MFFSKLIPAVFLIWNYFIEPDPAGNKIENSPRAYFVSPFGNDTYSGTQSAPFQSIQRLNRLRLHPGDSILFEGGKQFKGSLRVNPESPATRLHAMLIGSYGNGYAEIYSGNDGAIVVYRSSWLKLTKLKLSGSGRKKGNTRDGLSLINSHHISADDLIITGFQKSGVFIDSASNISVTGVSAHDNGFSGISVGRTNMDKRTNQHIYIGHCRAENNPGDPSNMTNHSGNGIVVSACTDVLIEYCTATNNGWDMPRKGNGPVGIWAFEADSVTIQHCLSFRNKTSVGGADGGGYDFDGGVTHSMVQYCLSYENQGAGYCLFQYLHASPWHDNVFRFNISENDGTASEAKAGIFIWNSSLDSNQFYNGFVYNNTIYNSKAAAISYAELSERKTFSFYNNIFVAKDLLIRGNKGADIFGGNNWSTMKSENQPPPKFRKYGTPHPVSADAIKLFGYYKIPVNSPLRKSGVDLFTLYGMNSGGFDFNGGRPPATGIGASF